MVWSRSTPKSNPCLKSPSFSYFGFKGGHTSSSTSTPDTPSSSKPPPYPWNNVYNSPSLSASYPIVTLPRSQRKKNQIQRPTVLGTFFGKPNLTSTSISMESMLKPPPSNSSCSSCSCSGSSCSACSSCYDIPDNIVSLAQYPFLRERILKNTRRRIRKFPKCDMTCYLITSFVLLCLVGIAATFIYFYLFAPIDTEDNV